MCKSLFSGLQLSLGSNNFNFNFNLNLNFFFFFFFFSFSSFVCFHLNILFFISSTSTSPLTSSSPTF